MKNDILLVHVGEIHLKGLNRSYFERTLVKGIERALRGMGAKVDYTESRAVVRGFDSNRRDEAAEKVRRVFGVHAISPAVEVDKDMDMIRGCALELMRGKAGTFKVLARRSDKRFPLNSMELAADVGGFVLTNLQGLSVDVHKPEIQLSVEIRKEVAYIYTGSIPAEGGLPVGTSGKAMLLLSGGIDSPVAGWMLAKRGAMISAVHFESPPYTSAHSRNKVIKLAELLSLYTGPVRLHIVPFTKIQMEIYEKCPNGETTLIMRRFMMRIACALAERDGISALITGESLGQVASQTMEALAATDDAAHMPVFRPLIGMDKLEIIERAQHIGTFETSILPYEDCCTVFVPKHPSTRPKLDRVRASEEKLDVQALVSEAVVQTELLRIGVDSDKS